VRAGQAIRILFRVRAIASMRLLPQGFWPVSAKVRFALRAPEL
jgi:hypothetical protein